MNQLIINYQPSEGIVAKAVLLSVNKLSINANTWHKIETIYYNSQILRVTTEVYSCTKCRKEHKVGEQVIAEYAIIPEFDNILAQYTVYCSR